MTKPSKPAKRAVLKKGSAKKDSPKNDAKGSSASPPELEPKWPGVDPMDMPEGSGIIFFGVEGMLPRPKDRKGKG